MNNIYKLLLVIAAGAAVYYYASVNNFNWKTFFSSKCDCHTGCDITKVKPTSPTPMPPAPETHSTTTTLTTEAALTLPKTEAPATSTPKIADVVKPAETTVPAQAKK